jgi:hypothetical protein
MENLNSDVIVALGETSLKKHSPGNNGGLTREGYQGLILFKFGNIASFGRSIHNTRNFAWSIYHLAYIPKKPSTIRKIALALEIDEIVLAQFYAEQQGAGSNEV